MTGISKACNTILTLKSVLYK